MIKQLCECCNKWIDQRLLVWDLAEASEGEEDRLICLTCQNHASGVVAPKALILRQGEQDENKRP